MKTFPLVEVTGTNDQIGLAIGETMKNQIQKEISERKINIKNYDQEITKTFPYLEVTKKYFPQYLDELKGIADGSGVTFQDIFFVNNQEVFDTSEEHDRQDIATDHCTITVSFGPHGPIIGHNEDMEGNLDVMYLLKATDTKGNSFFGLNYATGLPGCAASINSHGLVQCINSLNQEAKIGVPKFFLARAILDAKTLAEAENIVRNTPRASGFNHVLIQENTVINIEVAGSDIDVQKVEGQPYVHTNHYLSPKLKSMETFRTKSSDARYATATQLIHNGMDSIEMKHLLSDTSNPEYPIRRQGETVGSLVFIPHQHLVQINYGPPNIDTFIDYSI